MMYHTMGSTMYPTHAHPFFGVFLMIGIWVVQAAYRVPYLPGRKRTEDAWAGLDHSCYPALLRIPGRPALPDYPRVQNTTEDGKSSGVFVKKI